MTDSETTIDSTVVPDGLCEREQWVCWQEKMRDGKRTKIPVTPGTGAFASSTDPETWTGFETALEYVETELAAGVGFVFTDDDPIVGVDLDDCRDPESGDGDERALEIIERFDSYTEISPSGTGYHVLITGALPDGRNRRGSIELYDTARFFTVTGEHVAGTPTQIKRRQDELEAIHQEHVADTGGNGTAGPDGRGPVDERVESVEAVDAAVDLEDEAILEKATNASNGEKFDRLWNGRTVGYDSQSEADMALCCLLAFWTGGDQTRMDRLFRQSGLFRGKWDEVHYADGSTYGEKTIVRAIANTSAFYDPDSKVTSRQSVSGKLSSDASRDEMERSRAYLIEKNRLLADRVDELEATLERKDERIDVLETELERLEVERTDRKQERSQSDEERTTTNCTDEPSETVSKWRRIKQWVGTYFQV